jgi:hypothetical protein
MMMRLNIHTQNISVSPKILQSEWNLLIFYNHDLAKITTPKKITTIALRRSSNEQKTLFSKKIIVVVIIPANIIKSNKIF